MIYFTIFLIFCYIFTSPFSFLNYRLITSDKNKIIISLEIKFV